MSWSIKIGAQFLFPLTSGEIPQTWKYLGVPVAQVSAAMKSRSVRDIRQKMTLLVLLLLPTTMVM